MRRAGRSTGFTLIEIMIVIAIAAPAWWRNRTLAAQRSCQENLIKIAESKERWALDYNKRLWVYLGGTSPTAPAASLEESVEVVQADLPSKLSREGIKVMLKAYEDIKTYPVLPPEAYRVVKAATPPKVLERVVASRNRHRFIMPLGGKITSRYGYRQAPMGGARRYHRGVDIAGPAGSAIRSAGEGEVLKVTRSLNEGLHVILQHADRFQTAYFHLSRASVKKGQWIKQGQVIGYEGSSGLSTGPHLHFEVRKNGRPVDPSFYIEELNRR